MPDIDLGPESYRSTTRPSGHAVRFWVGVAVLVVVTFLHGAIDDVLWGFLLVCGGCYVGSHYVRWVGSEPFFPPGGLMFLAVLIGVIMAMRTVAPVINSGLQSLLGW